MVNGFYTFLRPGRRAERAIKRSLSFCRRFRSAKTCSFNRCGSLFPPLLSPQSFLLDPTFSMLTWFEKFNDVSTTLVFGFGSGDPNEITCDVREPEEEEDDGEEEVVLTFLLLVFICFAGLSGTNSNPDPDPVTDSEPGLVLVSMHTGKSDSQSSIKYSSVSIIKSIKLESSISPWKHKKTLKKCFKEQESKFRRKFYKDVLLNLLCFRVSMVLFCCECGRMNSL